MKNYLKTSFLAILILSLLYGIYQTLPIAWNIISSIVTEGVNTETDIPSNIPFTGSTNTGSISTGVILPVNTGSISNTGSIKLSLIEKLNTQYSRVTYTLPMQPVELLPGMSYSDRSSLLVDYMTNNTIKISLEQTKERYMYISLRKKPVYPIFVYWNNSTNGYAPKSGNLSLDKAVVKLSDTDYIFDLSKLPYTRFYDQQPDIYNWQLELNRGKSPYITFASKGFDGNGVKSVLIYSKK